MICCHRAFICVPWRIHMCAMNSSFVCRDAFAGKPCMIVRWLFTCVPWLIHMFICVQRQIHTFTPVPWLLHTYAMTHSDASFERRLFTHVQRFTDDFIVKTWLTNRCLHTCAITHWYLSHESLIRTSRDSLIYTCAGSEHEPCTIKRLRSMRAFHQKTAAMLVFHENTALYCIKRQHSIALKYTQ